MEGKFTIEHWRDGECIRRYEGPNKIEVDKRSGLARIVFPPGGITLATADELRFNVNELIDTLSRYREGNEPVEEVARESH